MPARGVMIPITTSEVAGMFREVFAKSIAVDVIVVNPRFMQVNVGGCLETPGNTDHRKEGTTPPET